MPPADEPQLSPKQRTGLLEWMRRTIVTVDSTDPANRDPGPAPIRRLSLPEFNATVRDLLGFEFDAGAAVGMTDDGADDRFANLAAGLDLSPAVLEKQFAAADQILDRLFGVELSSNVNGRIQDHARATRELMFGLKPGEWRAVNREVSPPPDVTPREAARAIIAPFVRRDFSRAGEPGRSRTIARTLRSGRRAGQKLCRVGAVGTQGRFGFAQISLSHRNRSGRPPAGRSLSARRPGVGHAALLLSLVQHAG